MVVESRSDSGSLPDTPLRAGDMGAVASLHFCGHCSNDRTLTGFRQHRFVILWLESHKKGSHWAKAQVSAGPDPSGGSRRDCFLALFTFQRLPASLGP